MGPAVGMRRDQGQLMLWGGSGKEGTREGKLAGWRQSGFGERGMRQLEGDWEAEFYQQRTER